MDKGSFELDQPCKQIENKMQVIGKISSKKIKIKPMRDCGNAQTSNPI